MEKKEEKEPEDTQYPICILQKQIVWPVSEVTFQRYSSMNQIYT